MKVSFKTLLMLTLSILILIVGIVNAQLVPVPVQCGTILEAELTTGELAQDYAINLRPGDLLTFVIDPFGDVLNPHWDLFDPSDTKVGYSWRGGYEPGSGAPEVVENFEISATGEHVIRVSSEGPGAYILSIGCTLRDGTVINPGDVPSTDASVGSAPAFSGVGFPGLAPVDFANVIEIPLISGTATTGTITPTSEDVVGFTFTGNADQLVDLTFSRVAGNLNLGIVVLSAANEVIFQASLVTSEMITTRLRLPTAGDYTIGVFRIDLLPPATPEGTAFQLTATLN